MNRFKELRELSFLIIPFRHGIQTKNYNLGAIKLLAFGALYTLVVVLFVLLVLLVTPAGNLISRNDIHSLRSQNDQITTLNNKIIQLTREVEHFSTLNKRLQHAIFLGDSTLQKGYKPDSDKQKKTGAASQAGGSLLYVLKKIIAGFEEKKDEPVYFLKPVSNNFISRNFNADRGHMGLDYPVKVGSPIYASAPGYVIFSGYTAEDGYMIILEHNNDYTTVYKHCSVLNKKVRDKVLQGEVIALSGNTGLDTTGPHLHFEIWKEGQVIDPKTVLIN